MVDGSDIFGDGVNIAARLQELAEPGGVVVSASVYDQVHNKLSLGFDCLGQQQMKNIVPVISYRVAMGGVGRHSFPFDKGPTPQAGAVAASEAGAQRIRDRYEPSKWMSSITDRLANLPRPIAATLTVSGFLILIYVFTGLNRIWFHWPVAALLFVGILRTVLRQDLLQTEMRMAEGVGSEWLGCCKRRVEIAHPKCLSRRKPPSGLAIPANQVGFLIFGRRPSIDGRPRPSRR